MSKRSLVCLFSICSVLSFSLSAHAAGGPLKDPGIHQPIDDSPIQADVRRLPTFNGPGDNSDPVHGGGEDTMTEQDYSIYGSSLKSNEAPARIWKANANVDSSERLGMAVLTCAEERALSTCARVNQLCVDPRRDLANAPVGSVIALKAVTLLKTSRGLRTASGLKIDNVTADQIQEVYLPAQTCTRQ